MAKHWFELLPDAGKPDVLLRLQELLRLEERMVKELRAIRQEMVRLDGVLLTRAMGEWSWIDITRARAQMGHMIVQELADQAKVDPEDPF